jgi:hypothetical protein
MIDYTTYPHIMDAILGFASHAVLLTFRATSTEYCDRADALLTKHLVLRHERPIVNSVLGRHPTSFASHNQPMYLWDNGWLHNGYARPRLIDHRGPSSLRLHGWLRELIRAATIRVTYPVLPTFGAFPANYVLFTCTPHLAPTYDHPPDGWALDGFTGRLVLNLCPSSSYFDKDLLPSTSARPIAELVVIFPACRACLGAGGVPVTTVLRSLLRKLVLYARTPSFSPIKTTFVNVESLRGLLLAKDFFGAMTDRSPVKLPEIVEVLMGGGAAECEYLSLEEYEARVGWEQFRIETDPEFVLR